MSKMTHYLLALGLGLMSASSAAFAQDAMTTPTGAPNPAPRDASLKPVFDDFGGKAGLVSLMDDFMTNLLADARTRPYFENADQAHIKAELVDQFCVILDGPCTYTGKDMVQAHRNLGIDRAGFYALVEDLQLAMNKHNIPFRSQNKLLGKLAPMHREVVTK
ncbi:group 1 truncated hemoglobin [Dyella ginsengisoli]|uniref:Group 1 truncated hemoglobin n=1 Tax=Dyella ginsengisoli TaxID=363848 RepID=A0ABW8JQ10_9GAMM